MLRGDIDMYVPANGLKSATIENQNELFFFPFCEGDAEDGSDSEAGGKFWN